MIMEQEVLALLERLVGFDTVSSKSNLDLIDFVETYLAGYAVPTMRLPNADGDKAALLASIGPVNRPGVVLSGHTDVVTVTGQAWTGNPFTLRIQNGRAYGRGTVDMKGFLALCLAAVPMFKAASLRKPVHLVFSYDEETTCRGCGDAIQRFGRDLPKPLAVIVGEPTDMQVADAHKSVVTFNTEVHGFEVHSSKPHEGANAIHGAALLVAELDRIADDMRQLGDPTGRFDPPYTTVHVGEISGGTARNIVPKICRFHWEYRGIPGIDADALVVKRFEEFGARIVEPKLRLGHPSARIVTINDIRVPGLAPEPGSSAERLALALTGRNATVTMPYGTEAGQFQAAQIPTIVCGPGSIDQAHTPDEYISLDALQQGARFLTNLAAHLASDWT